MDNTKPDLKGEFSLFAKRITLTVDGVKYDFSEKIPDYMWRIGVDDNEYNLSNPEINWKIRCELSKEITKLVKEFLGRQDIRIIL